MQNDPNGAAGEAVSANAAGLVHDAMNAMLSVDRRSVLRSVANAGVATVAAGGLCFTVEQVAAAQASAAADIETTLSAYLAEARALRRMERAYSAAYDRLPAWAAPGPDTMFSDGTKGGGTVGNPEIAVLPTPDPERQSVRYVIRPSPREVWERATWMLGGRPLPVMRADGTVGIDPPSAAALANRRRQRLAGFKAVRRVLARIREQRAERERLGLPQLGKQLDAAGDRLDALEARLAGLAADASPLSFAVLTIFEHMHEEDEFTLSLLRRLAPSLSGLVRVVVDDMLARGEGSMRNTLLAGGEGIV